LEQFGGLKGVIGSLAGESETANPTQLRMHGGIKRSAAFGEPLCSSESAAVIFEEDIRPPIEL